MEASQLEVIPHVILLPLPLQGPVNCFLKLSHLLSHSDLKVTFVIASFVHNRLPNLQYQFPKLRFLDICDGIDGDHPRPPSQFPDMARNFEAGFVERLQEFVGEKVTCLIADGVFTLAGRKAMEVGIPVVYFSTLSPSCIWASCSLVPELVDHGQVPFINGELDDPVTNIPGTEVALRRRDLPGICRAQDMSEPYVQLILRECRELPIAQGHILNTCDELEGTALLSELRSLFPNIYTVGPIHSLFKNRIFTEQTGTKMGRQCNNGSFWEEDKSCLTWLDSQPSNSVLFVSFGSILSLADNQRTEFWHGLVNSGVRFLWVQRSDHSSRDGVNDDDFKSKLPLEILKGAKERGHVVTWAPQEEVLAHRAVGGFLTHSGWNSTLESVAEGVPMICWPCGIDQLVISRFVDEVWRVGIDMKDKCDRVVIENVVRDVMEKRKVEFSEVAGELAKLANDAIEKGGSSWSGLDRLIEDIRLMKLHVPK